MPRNNVGTRKFAATSETFPSIFVFARFTFPAAILLLIKRERMRITYFFCLDKGPATEQGGWPA